MKTSKICWLIANFRCKNAAIHDSYNFHSLHFHHIFNKCSELAVSFQLAGSSKMVGWQIKAVISVLVPVSVQIVWFYLFVFFLLFIPLRLLCDFACILISFLFCGGRIASISSIHSFFYFVIWWLRFGFVCLIFVIDFNTFVSFYHIRSEMAMFILCFGFLLCDFDLKLKLVHNVWLSKNWIVFVCFVNFVCAREALTVSEAFLSHFNQ